MAIEATDGGTTRSSGLSGGEKRTIKDVVKQGINSGKMKLVKQEVPFGGPGKAAIENVIKVAKNVTKEEATTIAGKLANRTAVTQAGSKVKINPVALGSKVTVKGKSAKDLEAAREASQTVGKSPTGRAGLTKISAPMPNAKILTKTPVKGDKPFTTVEKLNTKRSTLLRPATATEKAASSKAVVVKKMTAVEKTAAKNASSARKNAPAEKLESMKPTTAGKRMPEPKANPGGNFRLRKSFVARMTKQSQRAQADAGLKGPGKLKSGTLGGKLRESTANAPVPKKEIESRSLKVATRAASEAENVERGRTQPTIESRSSKVPKENPRETEILRKVGKRDYNDPLAIKQGRTANILARKVNQDEADRQASAALNNPKVKAQDAVRAKKAIDLIKSDKTTSRKIKQAPKKTFRGKAK